jgi:hypothetical protein
MVDSDLSSESEIVAFCTTTAVGEQALLDDVFLFTGYRVHSLWLLSDLPQIRLKNTTPN